MILSRKCFTLFMWYYAKISLWLWVFTTFHFMWCTTCLTTGITVDRFSRDLSTSVLQKPQGDEALPVGFQTAPQNSCYPFTNYDSVKREFYSPGYPSETYPNNSDCFVTLTAPEGHIIVLDFRDWFQIEPSPGCKNDYLEIRDGPNGFNKLCEGRTFCGLDTFPPMIRSTDRYLWIHFKSDENIEHKGFKAVFEYVPRPTLSVSPELIPCHMQIIGEEQGILGRHNISSTNEEFYFKYNLPFDCVWEIVVRENWKIQLHFEKFTLDKPNDCESNFIEIFSDRTDMSSLTKKFCGSMADSIASKHNVMYVRFFNEIKGNKSYFEANFTAFRDYDKNSPKPGCREDEFDCDDSTCIAHSLKCNGYSNCRYRADEEECPKGQTGGMNNEHITIIMVIFSLILAGMCFTFIFNCIKKLIRDHQTIQEYIRQSREQQLNELDKQEQVDKKSKSGSRPRTNSSPSIDRFGGGGGGANCTSATTPCYVPGGELLPILIRNDRSASPPDGDDAGNHQNIYTVDNENAPEMCDSACQTRESLFTTQGYSSGNSTPRHSVRTNSPPAPFSTFGYKKDHNNKFKAEAKIEMGWNTQSKPTSMDEKRRPYSAHTTKSAPDVIVTH